MDPRWEELRAHLEQKPGRSLTLPGLTLRESAVLVPLFLRDGVPYVLFTRRPTTLRTHAGQISFPGGTRDAGDATPLHTALREMEEELGVPREAVTVLGLLDEIPTITEFRIAPFVGVIPGDVAYRPNPEEVAGIIEVPIPHLLQSSTLRVEQYEVKGRPRDVYFYDFQGHTIWGATARILRDLLQIVNALPSWTEGNPR